MHAALHQYKMACLLLTTAFVGKSVQACEGQAPQIVSPPNSATEGLILSLEAKYPASLSRETEHPRKDLGYVLTYTILYRNASDRDIAIRAPTLGQNLKVFGKKDSARDWKEFTVDDREMRAIVVPHRVHFPDEPSIIMLVAGQGMTIATGSRCEPGRYSVRCEYVSSPEAGVNWVGKCESDILVVTVPDFAVKTDAPASRKGPGRVTTHRRLKFRCR